MLNINCDKFEKLKKMVVKGSSFVASGVTSFFRLVLLNKIKEYSDRKIIFVTSN